jgi:hypothetical protein
MVGVKPSSHVLPQLVLEDRVYSVVAVCLQLSSSVAVAPAIRGRIVLAPCGDAGCRG